MEKKAINVEGMTCASCANAVERATKSIDGVNSASVNLATNKLTVEYDNTKVNLDIISKAVDKAGYKLIQNVTSKTMDIGGMTCASCANAVERATKKLEGVSSSSVNLATEKLAISFDPEVVTEKQIKETITKAGYFVKETQTVDKDKEDKEKAIKRLWYRFLFSTIFSLPLLYISMGHMIGLPLPEIINPHHNPLNFAIVQLILTLPVVIMGYKFYSVGFKALIRRNPNMDSLIAIGTSSAFLYGIFAIIMIANGKTEYANNLYFESAAVIITLITLGKYFEALSKGKTSEAIKKLMGLSPKTATIIKDEKEDDSKDKSCGTTENVGGGSNQ